MVPVRMLNVWLHFKHLILFKSEVFKLKLKHLIHLFSFKFAIYARHCCSVWKALLNSFSFIIPSTSTCGEKSVQNNTDINHINSTKDTALTLAAEQGHTEIVNLLITNGANVNYINKNYDTALLLAAEQGHTEIVNLLITNGANVNHKTKFGNTALTKAAKNGHLNVVDLLIANDADINQINLRV